MESVTSAGAYARQSQSVPSLKISKRQSPPEGPEGSEEQCEAKRPEAGISPRMDPESMSSFGFGKRKRLNVDGAPGTQPGTGR